MTKPITQSERIATLEIQVTFLLEEQKDMNKKLDDLLELRNKGMGVFWLASILFGTSLMGALSLMISWLKA